jgi:sugar lactone lactonase YvrE
MVPPNTRGSTIVLRLMQALIGAIFIIGLAGCATFDWALQAGSTGGDGGRSVAIDTAGNVYVTGGFFGTVDFDPGPGILNLVASSTQGAFVAKYTPAGSLIWARALNGSEAMTATDIAVDAVGNAYLAGFFQGTCDFDPGGGTFNITSLGAEDAFVLKISSTGGFVWARSIGGPGRQLALSIALNSGSVSIIGNFSGTVDFNPGPGVFNLTPMSSNPDIFVLKLTSSGLFQWARRFGGPAYGNDGRSIATDASGGIYVGGSFGLGSMVMDSFTLINSGPSDAGFIAKLNSAGTVVFAGRFGPESQVNGVDVDPAGNMIAAGSYRGTVDFDPGSGTSNLSSGYRDGFVVKLNPAGSLVWCRSFHGGPNDIAIALDVAADASGNVYSTGLFLGTTDFDPGITVANLTSSSLSHDVFISKLSPGGGYVWAGRQGGPTYDLGWGIAVHGCSAIPTQVNIIGVFSSAGDFDPTVGTANLTSAGTTDMFTAQLTFPTFAVAQHLYVSSQGRVLSYPAWGPPLSSPAIFVAAGSGGPSQPTGLTFGPDCNLYVSNFSSNQVMRYDGATGAPLPSTGNSGAIYVSSQSGGLVTPHGLAFGKDGRLYGSSVGTTSGVLRYDGVTGVYDINFTGLNPPVYARGVAFGGPAGDLYVTSNHDVLRFDRITGTFAPSWNLATDPGAITHYDLTFGPGGDLYVTAFETNKVLRFNGTTGAPLPDFVPAASGGLRSPMGLAFGPDGNLYVSSTGNNQILRYNGTTGAFMGVYASGSGLSAPSYLVFGP